MGDPKLDSSVRSTTAGKYILESDADRDRMYILFDLWREDFHRMFRRALDLAELPTDPDKANFRMLDMCCGEGLVSADILDCYPNVRIVGIDRDPEASEAGRIGYEHLRNLRIYTRDVHEPFPPEFEPGVGGAAGELFDFALFRLALTHLTEGVKVMRNVFAALKPGGVVLLFDPTITTYENCPHPSFHILNEIACRTWKYFGTYDAGNVQESVVREAGFEVLESSGRVYEVGGESHDGQMNLKLGLQTLIAMRKGLVERAKVISAEDFDSHIKRIETEIPTSAVGSWAFRQTIARKPR